MKCHCLIDFIPVHMENSSHFSYFSSNLVDWTIFWSCSSLNKYNIQVHHIVPNLCYQYPFNFIRLPWQHDWHKNLFQLSFFAGRCRPRPAAASKTSWSPSQRRWRACRPSSRWRNVRSWASSRWRWRRWSRRRGRWPRLLKAVVKIWATSNLHKSDLVRRNKRERSLSSLHHFK